MKAIMLMFDSLNREMLSPYGCTWTHTPNFMRLAQRCAVFDNCYVGSMPCMPARRELHTGRYNFLHRGWGPVEPFDDSIFEQLQRAGITTHLCSDHYHYWEDGGATYHNRYSSWEGFRGQEGDPWKCLTRPEDVPAPPNRNGRDAWGYQDWINRTYIRAEKDFPQAQTFAAAMEFLEKNHRGDDWLLHVEAFDPHEPFYVPEEYLALFPDDYDQDFFDWPYYGKVTEDEATIRHIRRRYAALLAMCDKHLGMLLDRMDEYELWKDALLIVHTDHGFLLGEHGFWGKCAMPFYNEVAHTPLFLHVPGQDCQGKRIQALVQSIDIPATVLSYFGQPRPERMQGIPLLPLLQRDEPIREAAIFGIHGGQIGCTDGRYVYLRSPQPENTPLYEYTLMPTCHGVGRAFFRVEQLQQAQLHRPFSFTKGCPVMQVPTRPETGQFRFPTELFDLQNDPQQLHPIHDAVQEQRLTRHIIRLMRENDAPAEQYERMGLSAELPN